MPRSHPVPLHLTVDPDPDGERRAEILSNLRRFNRSRASDPRYEPLTLVASDPSGALAGGLDGEFGWRWLHVDLRWVREEARGRGLGSALLHLAESEARRARRGRAEARSAFDLQTAAQAGGGAGRTSFR